MTANAPAPRKASATKTTFTNTAHHPNRHFSLDAPRAPAAASTKRTATAGSVSTSAKAGSTAPRSSSLNRKPHDPGKPCGLPRLHQRQMEDHSADPTHGRVTVNKNSAAILAKNRPRVRVRLLDGRDGDWREAGADRQRECEALGEARLSGGSSEVNPVSLGGEIITMRPERRPAPSTPHVGTSIASK